MQCYFLSIKPNLIEGYHIVKILDAGNIPARRDGDLHYRESVEG